MALRVQKLGRSCAWPSIHVFWPPREVRAASNWQVSSYGRLQRPNGTVTWGSKHISGYRTASISRVPWYVHRLVIHAFRGPAGNQLAWQVNHLDGNKANNRLDNLEYATPRQNVRHAFDKLPRDCGGVKLSIPVSCRALTSNSWTTYPSMKEAATALGMSRDSVSRSCRQGGVVKGCECRLAAPKERAIDGEVWKQMLGPKTGYPVAGRMVSSLGRLKGRNGQIFTGDRRRDGYYTTTLRSSCETQHQTVLIHQLVARAFLWPPPSQQHFQINHKDGQKSNNCVNNLEYVTPAQNIAHSYWVSPMRTYNHIIAVESRICGGCNQWRYHQSITKAARELGVHGGNISHCLTGRYKQTGGYEIRSPLSSLDLPGEEWRYVDMPSLLAERSLRTSLGSQGNVTCSALSRSTKV